MFGVCRTSGDGIPSQPKGGAREFGVSCPSVVLVVVAVVNRHGARFDDPPEPRGE